VLGAVVGAVVVGGVDVGGAGDASSALGAACGCGGGAGAGAGGPVSTAGALGAVLRGVETAGSVVDGGAAGTAVVTVVFVSDPAGSSPILSRAVTVPNPTSRAARHASGSRTGRPPPLRRNGRPVAASSTASSLPDGSAPREESSAVAPETCTEGAFRRMQES
jgi:hypothetical protein